MSNNDVDNSTEDYFESASLVEFPVNYELSKPSLVNRNNDDSHTLSCNMSQVSDSVISSVKNGNISKTLQDPDVGNTECSSPSLLECCETKYFSSQGSGMAVDEASMELNGKEINNNSDSFCDEIPDTQTLGVDVISTPEDERFIQGHHHASFVDNPECDTFINTPELEKEANVIKSEVTSICQNSKGTYTKTFYKECDISKNALRKNRSRFKQYQEHSPISIAKENVCLSNRQSKKLLSSLTEKLSSQQRLSQEVQLLYKVQDKLTNVQNAVHGRFPPSINILNRANRILLCLNVALKKLMQNQCFELKSTPLLQREPAFVTKMNLLHCITDYHKMVSTDVMQLKQSLERGIKGTKEINKINHNPDTLVSSHQKYLNCYEKNNSLPFSSVFENCFLEAEKGRNYPLDSTDIFKYSVVDTNALISSRCKMEHSLCSVNDISPKISNFQPMSLSCLSNEGAIEGEDGQNTIEMKSETSLSPTEVIGELTENFQVNIDKTIVHDSLTMQTDSQTPDLLDQNVTEKYRNSCSSVQLSDDLDYQTAESQRKRVQFKHGKSKASDRTPGTRILEAKNSISTDTPKPILKKAKFQNTEESMSEIPDTSPLDENKLGCSEEPMEIQFCDSLCFQDNSTSLLNRAVLDIEQTSSNRNISSTFFHAKKPLISEEFSTNGSRDNVHISAAVQQSCHFNLGDSGFASKHTSKCKTVPENAIIKDFSNISITNSAYKRPSKLCLESECDNFLSDFPSLNSTQSGTECLSRKQSKAMCNITSCDTLLSGSLGKYKSTSVLHSSRKEKLKYDRCDDFSAFSCKKANGKYSKSKNRTVARDPGLSSGAQFIVHAPAQNPTSDNIPSPVCVSAAETCVIAKESEFVKFKVSANSGSNFSGLAGKEISNENLPTLNELLQMGLIVPSVNTLSVVTPQGQVFASLNEHGQIVDDSNKIYDTLCHWCEAIPYLRGQRIHVSLKNCYENVLYRGHSLISLCKGKSSCLEDVHVPMDQDKVENLVCNVRNFPLRLNIVNMKVLPIRENEIGPEPINITEILNNFD